MAKESPTWGYERIQGALANLGHRISDTTVARILRAHGIEPAPEGRRETTWKTFVRAHWDVLASVDFTTIDVWTRGARHVLLAVLHGAGHAPGALCRTDGESGRRGMVQVARNVTDAEEGFLRGKKYVLMDRDG